MNGMEQQLMVEVLRSPYATPGPDLRPRKSQYGRAASQGKDKNREAKNRMLARLRAGGPCPNFGY